MCLPNLTRRGFVVTLTLHPVRPSGKCTKKCCDNAILENSGCSVAPGSMIKRRRRRRSITHFISFFSDAIFIPRNRAPSGEILYLWNKYQSRSGENHAQLTIDAAFFCWDGCVSSIHKYIGSSPKIWRVQWWKDAKETRYFLGSQCVVEATLEL